MKKERERERGKNKSWIASKRFFFMLNIRCNCVNVFFIDIISIISFIGKRIRVQVFKFKFVSLWEQSNVCSPVTTS